MQLHLSVAATTASLPTQHVEALPSSHPFRPEPFSTGGGEEEPVAVKFAVSRSLVKN